MRLFLLTALTMIAFASNSVLNRMALVDGAAGPSAFAALRLASGALMLAVLVAWRGGLVQSLRLDGARLRGVGALFLYMLGFSIAYLTIDAGVGALVLFGGVQITMFAGALWAGERISPRRWLGAGVSFAGLVYLLWPAGAAPDALGAGWMALGAIGWGVYSLLGRGAKDPLAETGANFFWCVPLGIAMFALWPDGMTPYGALLAILAGAVTSGLGYALWYSVLPRLEASAAAIAQLSVPLIAMAGGMVFLGEALTLRFAISAALVLGGILLALSAGSAPAGRR